MPSKRRLALFYLILVVGPLFVALLLAEVYVRVFSEEGYTTPGLLRERLPKYETAVFARHVFARERDTVEIASTGAVIDINDKGYRGPDFSREKPPGTVRIMVYGGSAAFDPNAGRGEDWPKRIERFLHEAGFPEVEVINAGVPGHISADSLGRFFAEGHLFRPDYVILYNAWNDIKFFRTDEPLLRRRKAYDKADDPRTNYQNWLDQVLCEVSQVYVRLRSRYFTWKLGIGTEGAVSEATDDANRIDEAALRQYRLNVELFVDAAKNVGAVPVLMTQARLVAADNTPEQRKKIRYEYQKMDHETLIRAFEEVDAILRDVSARKGVPLIDASAAMSGVDRFYYDHVHVTDEGSAELAAVAARRLGGILGGGGDSPRPSGN